MSRNSGNAHERLKSVTGEKPCEVCNGNHKCSRGDGGLILCGRRVGPVPGFRHLGPSKGDDQFHLYRHDDGDGWAAPLKQPAVPRDWGADAARYATAFTSDARDELARRLGLPVESLSALPRIGVSRRTPAGHVFTFPECDARGGVVGITERIPQPGGIDAKKMRAGGKRGLTIPTGWRERPGPLLLVEGASDTLALTAAGLPTIGRPSNTGGVEFLIELLTDCPADRGIYVVGENDRRGTDSWPGRDGAIRTAGVLRQRLARPVVVVMPPEDAKDVRQWLVTRSAGVPNWDALGQELVAHLAVVDEPQPQAERPQILITTEEHAVNDRAAETLTAADGVYQRGGLLVHVVELDAPTHGTAVRQPAGATVVRELTPPLLREQLTRIADWVKLAPTRDSEAEPKPAHPPGWCVQAVHARGMWPGVRPLESVVTHPVLLPDAVVVAARVSLGQGDVSRPPHVGRMPGCERTCSTRLTAAVAANA